MELETLSREERERVVVGGVTRKREKRRRAKQGRLNLNCSIV